MLGLERRFNGQEHWLSFQKTWAPFPASAWWLTSMLASADTSTHTVHTHASKTLVHTKLNKSLNFFHGCFDFPLCLMASNFFF